MNVRHRRSRSLVPVAIGLVAFASAACRTEGERVIDEPPSLAPPAAPAETVWDYLRAKYDRDGDGRVGAREYDRAGGSFERLDRSGDGVLDEADVDAVLASRIDMRSMAAQMALMLFLQEDEDTACLTLPEMQAAVAWIDSDRDGTLSAVELARRAQERPLEGDGMMVGMVARALEGSDLHGVLLAGGLDRNGDGGLASDEVEVVFRERANPDLVWESPEARAREYEEEASDGMLAREGALAPDFELAPPDGGAPVRLSRFRDERPVALIFGSFT